MRYRLNGKSSIKASYNRGQQYVHLATFSSVALPTDVWIPSSTNVKPQIGTQYAAGYFRDLDGWPVRSFAWKATTRTSTT